VTPCTRATSLSRTGCASASDGQQAPILRAARGDGDNESIRPHWNWPRLLRLTWLSLPLGVVMMLGSLMTNIPRYFIERFQGTHEPGIFAAMA